MVQWINFLQNSSFINPTRSPLLYEQTGTLAIVEPGLTAGRPAGRLAGRLAGRPLGRRNCCKVRKFKFCIFDF